MRDSKCHSTSLEIVFVTGSMFPVFETAEQAVLTFLSNEVQEQQPGYVQPSSSHELNISVLHYISVIHTFLKLFLVAGSPDCFQTQMLS